MILGTAGHIDHGKTALVRALTGVDTDRLPEEKRRGITIDLGFAPLKLSNGTTLGVVDVPGHEAFVRTMLAGATGIDFALIVIAADEGPMPQTREHLAILQLLDVRHAVVALTKADLVEAEWLKLVTDDVRTLLRETPFPDAELVPTSVVTGDGVDDLRSALERVLRTTHPRPHTAHDLFRLPIDRSFTVKGTGTVVTGTVWSGTLNVDDSVRIMPLGLSARVRGLQSHGAAVSTVGPGERAAVALTGPNVDHHMFRRGATLVTNTTWQATLIVRADLTLFADAPELRPRTKVRFHLATSDVGARVVAAGSPVAPGSSRTVRIALDEPVMARAGDRFVLRSASPLATIGGGTITDSNAPRRARPMPALALPFAERFQLLLAEAGVHGLPEWAIPVRLGLPIPQGMQGISALDGSAIRVGENWFASSLLGQLGDRLVELVAAHHAQHPLETGAPRQDVRSKLGVVPQVLDYIVKELVSHKRVEESGARAGFAGGSDLRIAGRSPQLSAQQQRVTEELMAVLAAAGHEPPSVAELEERFGPHAQSLLRHLEREQRVVQVEDNRFYTPEAVRELLHRLEGGMAGRGELAPTDIREVLGFSRKFLIPFLEYCDRRGYTSRQGNGRVWRGVNPERRM